MSSKKITRALISVSNKDGLEDLAKILHSKNIEMIVIDPIRVSFVNLVIDVRDYGL